MRGVTIDYLHDSVVEQRVHFHQRLLATVESHPALVPAQTLARALVLVLVQTLARALVLFFVRALILVSSLVGTINSNVLVRDLVTIPILDHLWPITQERWQ